MTKPALWRMHVSFVYTGWSLCMLAISHPTGGWLVCFMKVQGYKTTIKLSSFSEQNPVGVLQVRGTLECDELPSCDAVTPLCWGCRLP